MPDEAQEEKEEILEEFLEMPSLPSRKGVKRYIYQSVTDTSDYQSSVIKLPITVGKKSRIRNQE